MTELEKILLAAAEIEKLPEGFSEEQHVAWAFETKHMQHLTISEAIIAAKVHQFAGELLDE